MASYRRVTYEDRCQICAFLQVGLSVSDISMKLGFAKSTIYRELRRNSIRSRGYHARRAQAQARVRFRRCRRLRVIGEELGDFILLRLFEDWSPQQISKRVRRERGFGPSTQTIYRHVQRRRGELKFTLRRYNKRGFSRFKGGKRLKRGTSIWDRPKQANHRLRIGDWERDTLFIAGRRKLLVCTDRNSRYTKIAKVTNPTSRGVNELTYALLRTTGKAIHTITNDNGSEFCGGDLGKIPVYYCDPLKPQQRGTVENTIGFLRQYFKRNSQYDQITEQDITDVETAMNLRPRKCLDYKTPYEVFYGRTVALAS